MSGPRNPGSSRIPRGASLYCETRLLPRSGSASALSMALNSGVKLRTGEPLSVRNVLGVIWAAARPRYFLCMITDTVCGLFVAPVAQTLIQPE
jgi:hypothetical protein